MTSTNENLTVHQQRALNQLRVLTDGADDDVAISVLDSVDWDVQRAAELIFEPATSLPRILPETRRERFEVDDSRQTGEDNRRKPRSLASSLFSLFSFPVQVLTSVIRYIFGSLRIPIPLLYFPSLNFLRLRPSSSDPRGGTDRWIRRLEEETGAVCISRARNSQSAITSSTEVGPSTLTSRSVLTSIDNDGTRKLLPDFFLASYEEALRICQKEAKLACVILVSEEHDDVAEFKRSTLTNATLVKLLYDNDVLVWGGDVRDQEAWSAAQKLQATTYPFVAFLALQPRRNLPASSPRLATAPTLTVISRHQGPCVPATAPTSAQSLIEHLEQQLLPRVTPFLERIRITHRERERERMLREEQDRAFQDSAQKDLQRIANKMASERQQVEERQRKLDEIRMEEARRRAEKENELKFQISRIAWRRWTRRAVAFPDLRDSKDALRIAVRLPGGRRVIYHFSPTATLTTLYAFVDVQLLPPDLLPEDDPHTSPSGVLLGEPAIEDQILNFHGTAEWWGFKLLLAYPRQEIKWEIGRKLSDIGILAGGSQVIVEMIERGKDDTTDGYNSEGSSEG